MPNQNKGVTPVTEEDRTATNARKIRIVSRRDGFRRCGVAHPATPTFHPEDRFTPDELERLCRDPMLIVDVLDAAGRLAGDEAGAQVPAT